jgi:hypothetical protein
MRQIVARILGIAFLAAAAAGCCQQDSNSDFSNYFCFATPVPTPKPEDSHGALKAEAPPAAFDGKQQASDPSGREERERTQARETAPIPRRPELPYAGRP